MTIHEIIHSYYPFFANAALTLYLCTLVSGIYIWYEFKRPKQALYIVIFSAFSICAHAEVMFVNSRLFEDIVHKKITLQYLTTISFVFLVASQLVYFTMLSQFIAIHKFVRITYQMVFGTLTVAATIGLASLGLGADIHFDGNAIESFEQNLFVAPYIENIGLPTSLFNTYQYIFTFASLFFYGYFLYRNLKQKYNDQFLSVGIIASIVCLLPATFLAPILGIDFIIPLIIFGSLAEIIRISYKVISKETWNNLRNERNLADLLKKHLIVTKRNIEGKILYVNSAYLDITGFRKEDVIGYDVRSMNDDINGANLETVITHEVSQGNEWKGDIAHKNSAGDIFWTKSIVMPITNSENEVYEFWTIMQDITSTKIIHKKDIETAKFAAIGQATAQIFHDAMSPLTTISGNADILKELHKRDKLTDSKVFKISDRINKSVEKVKVIFDSVRSRIQKTCDIKEHDLHEMFTNAYDTIEHIAIKNNVVITCDYNINDRLYCDQIQVIQVLSNLLKNSIEAISNQEEKWIFFESKNEKGLTTITITDSGEGIPNHIQSKIFDNLYTTKGDRGGTGLGMGIVKEIIENHNGTISLNTDHPQNTQFIITFPQISNEVKKAA